MFGQQLARSDKCAFDLHMHSLTQWLEPTNICHCPKGEYAQMAAQMALLLQRFHLAAWNDYFVDQLINLPSTCEKPANCCMVQFGEKKIGPQDHPKSPSPCQPNFSSCIP